MEKNKNVWDHKQKIADFFENEISKKKYKMKKNKKMKKQNDLPISEFTEKDFDELGEDENFTVSDFFENQNDPELKKAYDELWNGVVTWKEKILNALNVKTGHWFTQRTIRLIIAEHMGVDFKTMPTDVTVYLYDLIKKGYVERAYKPASRKPVCSRRTEFLYRSTGKHYKRPERHLKPRDGYVVNPYYAELGFRIFHKYKKLPKWFRDMMI